MTPDSVFLDKYKFHSTMTPSIAENPVGMSELVFMKSEIPSLLKSSTKTLYSS